MRPLERGFAEQDPVVGQDPHGVALDPGEAGHQRLAVARLELVELAAIDQPRDHLAHVVGEARIARDDAVQLLRIHRWRRRLAALPRRLRLAPGEAAHDLAPDRQRMLVVEREVVRHPTHRGVHLGPTQVLGAHLLPGGRLHQRRTAQEDGAGALDDDRLVGHGRDIGPAGRGRAHHQRDLRNAARGELRLVVEDPPEVLAIGEDLVLQRQVGAAAVHQVEAWQPVLQRDLLGTQVLLDSEREVRAALHGRVVGNDDALHSLHQADAGHHAGPRRLAVIEAICRERRELQEGAAGIDQPLDPLADRHLAAFTVTRDRSLVATGASLAHGPGLRPQVVDQRMHCGRIGGEGRRGGIEGGVQDGHRCADYRRTAAAARARPGSPAG